MKRKNIFALLFAAAFAVVLIYLYQSSDYEAPESEASPEPEPTSASFTEEPFTGRVELPDVAHFYILENSAGRNLEKLETYIQGRAAGLHWAAEPHFKKHKTDTFIGLRLMLDSLGQFKGSILYSDSQDPEMEEAILKNVDRFWRYTPSTSGKLDMWIPVHFRSNWKGSKKAN